jgi:hypothetical protein
MRESPPAHIKSTHHGAYHDETRPDHGSTGAGEANNRSIEAQPTKLGEIYGEAGTDPDRGRIRGYSRRSEGNRRRKGDGGSGLPVFFLESAAAETRGPGGESPRSFFRPGVLVLCRYKALLGEGIMIFLL